MDSVLIIALLILVCLVSAAPASAAGLVLAEGGQSNFSIVVSLQASPSEKHAASELQQFLQQISGAQLPIVSDTTPKTGPEIVLGNSSRLSDLGVQVDWDFLGSEGYLLRTAGDSLVIAGGRLRGTMYGVYSFLEDYLGCRWFSSKVSHIPRRNKVEIPEKIGRASCRERV